MLLSSTRWSQMKTTKASSIVCATAALLSAPWRGADAHAHADDRLRFRAVADFGRCIEGYQAPPEECLQVLEVFVKGHPAQAFAAGKAVRAKLAHAAAVPFFATALARMTNESPDRALCADEDVAMALVSGLDLPARNGTTAQALAIFLHKCWPETKAAVSKVLSESGTGGYLAQNLCPRLAERGVTNPSCGASPVSARKPAEPPATERSAPRKQAR